MEKMYIDNVYVVEKKNTYGIKHSRKLKDKYMLSKFITCIMFMAVLLGLSVVTLLHSDRNFSENENRYLEQKPEFSASNVLSGEYMDNVEKYLADQFIIRDTWMYIRTKFQLNLGRTMIDDVFIGKDGYLLENHSESKIKSEAAGQNIENMKKFIEENKDNENINVLIVPTTTEIMDNKLPENAFAYSQQELLETIENAVGQDRFVAVRDELKSHNEEYIYYKTDHHWTTLGAYYAYREWLKKNGQECGAYEEFFVEEVAEDFLGTIQAKINYYQEKDKIEKIDNVDKKQYSVFIKDKKAEEIYPSLDGIYNMKKLDTKDKYAMFFGGNESKIKIAANKDAVSEAARGKKILVVKDSFANCFVPFMLGKYEEITMIDLRYFNESVKELMEKEGFTDVLVIMNVDTIVSEGNLFKLNK